MTSKLCLIRARAAKGAAYAVSTRVATTCVGVFVCVYTLCIRAKRFAAKIFSKMHLQLPLQLQPGTCTRVYVCIYINVCVCVCICCGPEPGRAQLIPSSLVPKLKKREIRREWEREKETHTLRQGKLQLAWETDKQPGVTQSITDKNMAASRFTLSNRFFFFLFFFYLAVICKVYSSFFPFLFFLLYIFDW